MKLQEYTYNRKTYTVDYRLKQFRHIAKDGAISFIEFYDELGDRIMCKMISENKCLSYAWM